MNCRSTVLGRVSAVCFPEALDRALHTIPVAEAHEPADVVVRIGSPVDLAPAPGAGRTFVMASHGAGSTVNAPMVGGANIAEAIALAPETMLLTPSAFARQGLIAQACLKTGLLHHTRAELIQVSSGRLLIRNARTCESDLVGPANSYS